MTLTLSDTDGTIKSIIDTSDIHKTVVQVFQTDAALTGADKVLLFEGEITSPILWNNRERKISFDILALIESEEIGFSPEAGDLPFIAESAVGRAWPLCFGSPIRVPAVKITEAVRGTSLTRYGQIIQTDLDTLCAAAEAAAIAEDAKNGIFGADTQQGFSDTNYATVINNLTAATTDLTNIIEDLSADSPTQRDNLIAYSDICQFLKRAEIDLELQTNIFIQATEAEEVADATLDDLQVQLLQAQAESPIDPSKIIDLENQIADAQQIKNDAAADANNAQLAIVSLNSDIESGTATKDNLEVLLLAFVLTQIIVEGGERFPQGGTVKIIVNGMKFSGTFSGQVFTIETPNLPFYTNVAISDSRPNQNTNEIFIEDTSFDLKGKYLYFTDKLTYCESQEGNRCFINPILYGSVGSLPEVPGILVDGEPFAREIFNQIVFAGGSIQEARVFAPKEWFDALGAAGQPTYANGRDNVRDQDYAIDIGDDVFLDGDFQEKYVANLIPSTSIVEVVAERNGEITQVPSRYYKFNLNESIAEQNATTITFRRPLTEYQGEGWSGEIFVSLISSEGPNTADVIEYLLNTYTSVTPDATTFASVSAAISKYPSHFALLERSDAITTIENIAWQARCATYVRNSIAFIKYLAAEEAALLTLTEDNIKDLIISTRSTEDLVTKFIAQWRSDYTIEHKEVVLRNNIPKYGEKEQNYDFYIYNIESLVVKSATFWMLRLSNTWKILQFTAFLDTLNADVFDTLEINLANNLVADQPIKGMVRLADYDANENVIAYHLETEVLFGDLEPHPFFWPATADPGLEYPTAKDPFAGSQ